MWQKYIHIHWYDMIYLLTAIGLSPGGRSTVHIYTLTIHRTIQNKQYINNTTILEECGPCPVLASYTLAFALQPRKKHVDTNIWPLQNTFLCCSFHSANAVQASDPWRYPFETWCQHNRHSHVMGVFFTSCADAHSSGHHIHHSNLITKEVIMTKNVGSITESG